MWNIVGNKSNNLKQGPCLARSSKKLTFIAQQITAFDLFANVTCKRNLIINFEYN